VIARPWDVVPATDSAIDTQAAEGVKAQLKALNFDQLTSICSTRCSRASPSARSCGA